MSDFEKLRSLMGYVENGTGTVVKIFQDEATKDYFVKVHGESHHGRTLSIALENAYSVHKQEF